MQEQSVPELLAHILQACCHVDGGGDGWIESLQRTLNHPRFPGRGDQFKQELATAILHRTISPEEYERLTDAAYDDQKDVDRELHDLWQHLYGNEPVTVTNAVMMAVR